MKRLVTIWLSLLVLLIAIHPLLAFHFCSGELASVVVPTQETSGCCSETTSGNTLNNHVIESTCCHTSVIELSTDDYLKRDSDRQIVPFSVLAFICARSLVADILLDSKSSSERMTPPPYICTEGRDLLTRFCVYII